MCKFTCEVFQCGHWILPATTATALRDPSRYTLCPAAKVSVQRLDKLPADCAAFRNHCIHDQDSDEADPFSAYINSHLYSFGPCPRLGCQRVASSLDAQDARTAYNLKDHGFVKDMSLMIDTLWEDALDSLSRFGTFSPQTKELSGDVCGYENPLRDESLPRISLPEVYAILNAAPSWQKGLLQGWLSRLDEATMFLERMNCFMRIDAPREHFNFARQGAKIAFAISEAMVFRLGDVIDVLAERDAQAAHFSKSSDAVDDASDIAPDELRNDDAHTAHALPSSAQIGELIREFLDAQQAKDQEAQQTQLGYAYEDDLAEREFQEAVAAYEQEERDFWADRLAGLESQTLLAIAGPQGAWLLAQPVSSAIERRVELWLSQAADTSAVKETQQMWMFECPRSAPSPPSKPKTERKVRAPRPAPLTVLAAKQVREFEPELPVLQSPALKPRPEVRTPGKARNFSAPPPNTYPASWTEVERLSDEAEGSQSSSQSQSSTSAEEDACYCAELKTWVTFDPITWCRVCSDLLEKDKATHAAVQNPEVLDNSADSNGCYCNLVDVNKNDSVSNPSEWCQYCQAQLAETGCVCTVSVLDNGSFKPGTWCLFCRQVLDGFGPRLGVGGKLAPSAPPESPLSDTSSLKRKSCDVNDDTPSDSKKVRFSPRSSSGKPVVIGSATCRHRRHRARCTGITLPSASVPLRRLSVDRRFEMPSKMTGRMVLPPAPLGVFEQPRAVVEGPARFLFRAGPEAATVLKGCEYWD
ncbi:hypothetical protein BJ546DRAFT_261253 [Cryomyces antarcticus]